MMFDVGVCWRAAFVNGSFLLILREVESVLEELHMALSNAPHTFAKRLTQ